jgi:chorismate mutase
MLLVNQKRQSKVIHVYLREAEKLRPDLKFNDILQKEKD